MRATTFQDAIRFMSVWPGQLMTNVSHQRGLGDASKSEIGAPDFRIVNEVPGEAAMNDATGFHDVTSIGN